MLVSPSTFRLSYFQSCILKCTLPAILRDLSPKHQPALPPLAPVSTPRRNGTDLPLCPQRSFCLNPQLQSIFLRAVPARTRQSLRLKVSHGATPTFHTSPTTNITLPARQRCLPQFLHLGPQSVTLRPSKVQPQSAKTTAVIAGLSTTTDGTQTIGFLVASVFVRLSARALRSFAAPTRTAE
jgi:hypothetical protein